MQLFVIICEIFKIIVHLLVIVQNNKICMVQGIKIKKKFRYVYYGTLMRPECGAAATVFPGTGSDIRTSSEIDK